MHKLWIKWWIVFIGIILVGAIAYGVHSKWVSPIVVKTTHNARLELAYEYGDRCGHKGRDTCSAWMGRFKEETTGLYFDKDINGFFYQTFVDGGRKSYPSWIQLSRADLGEEVPKISYVTGSLMFLSALATIMWLLFAILEVPDRIGRLKREAEREAARAKHEAKHKAQEEQWERLRKVRGY